MVSVRAILESRLESAASSLSLPLGDLVLHRLERSLSSRVSLHCSRPSSATRPLSLSLAQQAFARGEGTEPKLALHGPRSLLSPRPAAPARAAPWSTLPRTLTPAPRAAERTTRRGCGLLKGEDVAKERRRGGGGADRVSCGALGERTLMNKAREQRTIAQVVEVPVDRRGGVSVREAGRRSERRRRASAHAPERVAADEAGPEAERDVEEGLREWASWLNERVRRRGREQGGRTERRRAPWIGAMAMSREVALCSTRRGG